MSSPPSLQQVRFHFVVSVEELLKENVEWYLSHKVTDCSFN